MTARCSNWQTINQTVLFQTIKAGVAILGRVRQAQETKVTVSLPGNMAGAVMACHISEAYNKKLEAYVNDEVSLILL